MVYSACQWGILIVLAKLGSPEIVGQFALGLAVTAPIILFFNLQLASLQATDAKRTFGFGDYLALRLTTTALAFLVIAGVAMGYDSATGWVVFAIGVAKAFEAVSEAYHGLMQQHQRMERVAWSQILKGMASVTVITAWLALGGGVLGAAWALAAVWGLLLIGYDFRCTIWLQRVEPEMDGARFAPRWHWPTLASLAWHALPLGITTILIVLSFNIPRYVVEANLGLEPLGIFAALAYVSVVTQVVSNTIAAAAAPRLSRHLAAGEIRAFRSLVLKLAGIGAIIGGSGVIVAHCAGPALLTLLYRAEYAQHAGVFTDIMIGAALWCVATMFFFAATAARRQRSQTAAGLVILLTTLVTSVILIPREGLPGASAVVAWTGVAAFFSFGFIFLTIRPTAVKEEE